MAEFSKLVITKSGQALLAKAIAGETTIKFTKVATSSAEYEESALEELTELKEIQQTSLVSSVTRWGENMVKVEAEFDNHALTAGYYIRALGLYADDDGNEILYGATIEASGNCYMPAYDGLTDTGAIMQLITTVGNADDVNMQVNAAATATLGDVKAIWRELENMAETTIIDVLTIPTTGWVNNREGLAAKSVDITDSNITEMMTAYAEFVPESIEAAKECEFSPTIRLMDGILRVYANNTPSEELTINITLQSQIDISEDVPDITGSGVSVGYGLTEDEEGTISVDTDTVLTVEDMVDEEKAKEDLNKILSE